MTNNESFTDMAELAKWSGMSKAGVVAIMAGMGKHWAMQIGKLGDAARFQGVKGPAVAYFREFVEKWRKMWLVGRGVESGLRGSELEAALLLVDEVQKGNVRWATVDELLGWISRNGRKRVLEAVKPARMAERGKFPVEWWMELPRCEQAG